MDETFLMTREDDLKMVWIELKAEDYNPQTKKMDKRHAIQCFHPGEWDKMQKQYAEWHKMQNDPGYKFRPSTPPLNWLHAANWHRFTLLHDGTLPSDPETLKVK